MLVTLFTDAGFCPTSRLGSWAAWAKFDGQTLRTSGLFKTNPTGSDTAEVQAIINGVYSVLKEFNPEPDSKIIIQSDCKTAMKVLENPVGKKAKKFAEFLALRDKFQTLTVNLRVEFRHVEGHKGTSTKRNAVNTYCDKECKRILIEAKQSLKQKEPKLKLVSSR